MDRKFNLALAPHVHSGASTPNIMLMVVLALVPAMIASVYVFGPRALVVYGVTVASCLVFETLFNKATGRANSINDFSATITGVLLAMNLPASSPVWMCIIGGFVAIVIAKMVFGGLGGNPFNPALTARIFLLISCTAPMTAYTLPRVDDFSGATVLGAAKEYVKANGSLAGLELPELSDLFLGMNAGALGETSVLALLIGGVFLIARKIITWHIPVSFIGTVFLLTLALQAAYPEANISPLMHIMSGGLMLGAFFMATDYVTAPVYANGKLIFGVGCGVITVAIRVFGGYPEGVAFAILIMNAVTP
ncbi:MAG: RnfABCDGE type electron transport complex subunit D, partial [Deferribacteraceae bacterium]|nr:RnfABCDGE type electron transport complex subunit D [Deferribacteraceae bacterium]